MIKVGLTGGIGSGKSTIAKLFNVLGIPVFDSDSEAKKLYYTDSVLKSNLIDKFGPEVYVSDSQINRSFLISEVFCNREKLLELNALVHPRVKVCFDSWLNVHSNSKIVIKEAAILFESGADKQVDKKIVVIAPMDLRIARVINRDKTDKESVLERIKNQWPQEELVKRADYVVDNSGKVSVIRQVLQIYNHLSTIN